MEGQINHQPMNPQMGEEGRLDSQTKMEIILYSNGRENQREYRGGEIIRGQVRVALKDAVEVRSLDITFQGVGDVQWMEQVNPQGENSGFMNQPIKSQEIYLNQTQNILGTYPGETLLVSKGSHPFHFSFRLPQGIPASFSGTYGSVKYFLRARLVSHQGVQMISEEFLIRQEISKAIFAKFIRPAQIRLRRQYSGGGIKSFVAGLFLFLMYTISRHS